MIGPECVRPTWEHGNLPKKKKTTIMVGTIGVKVGECYFECLRIVKVLRTWDCILDIVRMINSGATKFSLGWQLSVGVESKQV